MSWRRGWADGLPWPRNGENYFPSSFALSLKKTQLQLRPVAFNNWGGVSCCESKPLFLAMALCSTWLWVTQNCNMTKICVLFKDPTWQTNWLWQSRNSVIDFWEQIVLTLEWIDNSLSFDIDISHFYHCQVALHKYQTLVPYVGPDKSNLKIRLDLFKSV